MHSVKEPLRKILGKVLLSFQELATILTRNEGIVNSTPLITVSDDVGHCSDCLWVACGACAHSAI